MADMTSFATIPSSVDLRVDASIKSSYPDFRSFALRVRGLLSVDQTAAAYPYAAETYKSLMSFDYDTLAEHPRVKVWRDAYRTMGLKASEFRSSIEQLVRRSLGDGMLNSPLALVDLYNRLSISFSTPMGAYDVALLSNEPLVVRTINSGDYFAPLGSASEKYPMTPKIAAYIQGSQVLCWALNHRDSRVSALTRSTDDALFVSEALDAEGARASQDALTALASCLAKLGAQPDRLVEFEVR